MQTGCAQCSAPFTVTKDDRAMMDQLAPVIAGKKFPFPDPMLCPDCRWQRRLCFRNERKLYHRKCDLSGRSMIAMHAQDTAFPVYYIREWLSDKWDARTYGRDFDFNRPFFEQFKELQNVVPHFNLFIDPQMDINSEFTNCSSESKNCYMISQAEKNEDCYYARGINRCRDCCDCLRVQECELCYECINATTCHRCLYVQDCSNCADCFFSSGLRGCKYCFGCHELAQKEYHIFNQPVSKEEWNGRITALTLSHAVIRDMRERSAIERMNVPHKASRLIQCEHASGDHLTECKNVRNCFDSKHLWDCVNCHEVLNGAKDCMDFSMWGEDCEHLYECCGCGYNVHTCVFVSHCWQNISNLLYCDCCFPSVRDCFGCFGIKQAQYCILNKQYSKGEYERLVPRIIEHMRRTPFRSSSGSLVGHEWGEFFPVNCSSFDYNESLAAQFFSLAKEEVLARGWRWRSEDVEKESYLGPAVSVPETIGEVSDDIAEKILTCEATGRPYKIIPQELRFYRTLGLPIPRIAPEERHMRRMKLRNPRHLWKRSCGKCGKSEETTYAPDRKEIVYCEKCYLKTVY